MKARRDEDLSFAGWGASALRLRGVRSVGVRTAVVPTATIRRRSPNRAIDGVGGLGAESVTFPVKANLVHALDAERSKSPNPTCSVMRAISTPCALSA